jgi:hypothetical protein
VSELRGDAGGFSVALAAPARKTRGMAAAQLRHTGSAKSERAGLEALCVRRKLQKLIVGKVYDLFGKRSLSCVSKVMIFAGSRLRDKDGSAHSVGIGVRLL